MQLADVPESDGADASKREASIDPAASKPASTAASSLPPCAAPPRPPKFILPARFVLPPELMAPPEFVLPPRPVLAPKVVVSIFPESRFEVPGLAPSSTLAHEPATFTNVTQMATCADERRLLSL